MKSIRYVRYSTVGALREAQARERATSTIERPGRSQTTPTVSYGILAGETVQELHGDIFAGAVPTGTTFGIKDVKLLAPCAPANVAAVGRNYQTHIKAMSQISDRSIPAAEFPGLFWKPSSCIIGTEENILLPPGAENVHYEAEMVLVMGKKTRNVTPAQAASHIFGITAGNDVSERGWQKNDLTWFRAKGSDTFGVLGPCIVTGLNYNDLRVESRVNGEVRQLGRTSELIFPVDVVVSYISQFVTLLPGDVIYTGTPGTTKAMQSGDIVEVEVEGVGLLRNRVQRASTTMD
jgi:2-keto-4-pentenoate hydratase/2-oxohepta-3-ene-1,7-dioic acid hydratase in catechol pathway